MDLYVVRPGAACRHLVDVRTVDFKAELGRGTLDQALESAAKEKHRRYFGRAWAFAIELRGALHGDALRVLETMAAEACQLSPTSPPAAALVRRWRREIECTLAFEWADAIRVQLGDRPCLSAQAALAAAAAHAPYSEGDAAAGGALESRAEGLAAQAGQA